MWPHSCLRITSVVRIYDIITSNKLFDEKQVKRSHMNSLVGNFKVFNKEGVTSELTINRTAQTHITKQRTAALFNK